jgi:hypothetical protein
MAVGRTSLARAAEVRAATAARVSGLGARLVRAATRVTLTTMGVVVVAVRVLARGTGLSAATARAVATTGRLLVADRSGVAW